MVSQLLADRLVERISSYGGCAVAFSGGVDSAVVLKAARLALGDRAVPVIGVGPALAATELADARRVAEQVGVELVEVETREIESSGYVENRSDRCFHCKTELYMHVVAIAKERGMPVVANGANTDDQGDYRPGQQAANDFEVRSPLVECGCSKSEVRLLAEHWGLSVADKPASPCLASRLAYGVEVTPERLKRVEAAEAIVRGLGLREFRVRCHEGDLARIEAPLADIARLSAPGVREPLVEALMGLGFRFVTLDLAGFETGSLNRVLPVETLGRWIPAGAAPATPGS